MTRGAREDKGAVHPSEARQEPGKGPCKKGHEIPTKGGREEEAGDRDKRCVNKRSFI